MVEIPKLLLMDAYEILCDYISIKSGDRCYTQRESDYDKSVRSQLAQVLQEAKNEY